MYTYHHHHHTVQVALIAASCWAGPIRSVVVVVVVVACCAASRTNSSADADSNLCPLCPDLCTLHPDLCTSHLWCFSSFNSCNHSICTGGGCHQLQLALVVLFSTATSAHSPFAHMVVHPLQLVLVVLFHPATGANTTLAFGQLALCRGSLCGGSCICEGVGIHENCTGTLATCTVWWWYLYWEMEVLWCSYETVVV